MAYLTWNLVISVYHYCCGKPISVPKRVKISTLVPRRKLRPFLVLNWIHCRNSLHTNNYTTRPSCKSFISRLKGMSFRLTDLENSPKLKYQKQDGQSLTGKNYSEKECAW